MPFRRPGSGTNPNDPTPAQQQAASPPSGFDSFQALRNMIGMGTRLAGGFVSNAGGPLGALAGGGSELLAEAIEGSLDSTSPYRIATEAAIGTVPLGKTLSAGRKILSAGKSGAFAGVGDIGRQVSEQYDPTASGKGMVDEALDTDIDWNRAGGATLLGSAVGGFLGHLAPTELGGVKSEFGRGQTATPKADVRANSGEPLRRANIANTGGGVRPPGPVYNIGDQTHGPLPREATIANNRMPIGGGDMGALSDMGEGATRSKPRPAAPTPRQTSLERNLERDMDAAMQENRVREMRRSMGLGGGLSDALTVSEQSLAREARNAAAQSELEGIKRTLGLEMELPTSTTRTITAETPTGRETAKLKFADPLAEEGEEGAKSGGRRSRAPGANGIELDPNVEEIIAKGMRSPEGSHNRTFAEWLIAGADIDEAMANAAKGVRPAPPGRVAQITGTIEGETVPQRALPSGPDAAQVMAAGRRGPLGSGNNLDILANAERRGPLGSARPDFDDELSRLMDDTGIPSDSVVTDPLARLLNATVDNPRPTPHVREALPRVFDETTGITDDIPGATGMNWVDEALDDVAWRGQDPGATPSSGAPPRQRGPRPPAPRKVPQVDAGDEQGLQDLLDFLQIDEAYGRADDVTRKGLGPLFGRSKAIAEGSNPVPKAEAAQEVSGNAPKILGNEKGIGVTEALIHSALGLTGAGIGAAIDDEGSNVEGALGGLAVGLSPALISKVVQSVGMSPEVLRTPEGVKEAAQAIYEAVPQWQRFAYLSDLRGLPANMWAGPYGSMITGGLEAWLSGDPRGLELLKRSWNPVAFGREWAKSKDEALELLRRGEIGRAEGLGEINLGSLIPRNTGELGQAFTTGTSLPGLGMTMGDVAARRFLQEAGFTLDEAKKMTLTNDALSEWGQEATLGKKSTLGQILFPFRRTPVNIAEQGAQRTPLAALPGVRAMNPDASWREIGVQQGLGGLAGYLGYQLGQELDDPRSHGQNMIRRTASNIGGRYSLPVSLGVLAGQTVGQGKNLNQRSIERAVETAVPLPGLDQIADTLEYGAGKAGLTSNPDPRFPRNLAPFPFNVYNDEPPMLSTLRLRRQQ